MSARSFAPPLVVFAISRAGIWALAALVYAALDPQVVTFRHDLGWAVDLWAQWDGVWYVAIAEEGYENPHTPAYFPLYPAVVALVGRALAGHFTLAALLVSLVACGAAFVLLHRLALRHLDRDGALRAVVYLAIFPTSVFLGAAYTESLFLALTLGSFLLAERGRFGWAGLTAGLALLCRLAGIALLPALVIMAWRADNRRSALLRVAPGLGVFMAWPLYLWVEAGNPLAFVTATSSAETGWNRSLHVLGPLGGIAEGAHAAFIGLGRLVPVGATVPADMDVFDAAFNLTHFGIVLLFLALTIVAWRRFGASYGAYAAVTLVLPLANPVEGDFPLLSLPRYLLACFPAFLALAWIGRRRPVHASIVLVSGLLLAVTILRWGLSVWVA